LAHTDTLLQAASFADTAPSPFILAFLHELVQALDSFYVLLTAQHWTPLGPFNLKCWVEMAKTTVRNLAQIIKF
jgi:hypothetical protein